MFNELLESYKIPIFSVALIGGLTILFVWLVKRIIQLLSNRLHNQLAHLSKIERLKAQRWTFHSILGLYTIGSLNILLSTELISPNLFHGLHTVAIIYFVLAGGGWLLSLTNILVAKYRDHFRRQRFPIHLPAQLFKLAIIGFIATIIIARLAHIPPWSVLTSLGATTALLTFVFKDTITSFIASLQLIIQNRLQIDDWVHIPQLNIKGIIEKITITEIKIKVNNGAIVTVSPSSLLSTNIINRRGIKKLKTRNINKVIWIAIDSISFASSAMLEQVNHLTFANDNRDDLASAHKITNIELFKAYSELFITQYLERAKSVSEFQLLESETFTSGAISLEINISLQNATWPVYEKTNLEIYAHLIAMLPIFQLKIFSK